MATIINEFSYDWEKVPTDFKDCTRCESIITGDMYIPIVTIGKPEDLDYNEVEIRLCDPCYSFKVLGVADES